MLLYDEVGNNNKTFSFSILTTKYFGKIHYLRYVQE